MFLSQPTEAQISLFQSVLEINGTEHCGKYSCDCRPEYCVENFLD